MDWIPVAAEALKELVDFVVAEWDQDPEEAKKALAAILEKYHPDAYEEQIAANDAKVDAEIATEPTVETPKKETP